MVVDLCESEVFLLTLALSRMRLEINVDHDPKVSTMNDGQKQACRYTIRHLDMLTTKLNDKMKEVTRG